MKSPTFQRLIGAILFAGLLMGVPFSALAPAAAAEREATIPGRSDITTRALIVTPEVPGHQAIRAAAVMFVGGNGDLSAMKGNFLMRIRQRMAAGGILLAFPDAPSDRAGKNNLQGNFRASEQHARDVQGVVQFLKQQTSGNADLPVFVIGTSRGSTSAANAAARLGPSLIAGAALTSTVTREGERGQISVHQTPIKTIKVPVLILHHREDGCSETPPGDVPALMAAVAGAPKVEMQWFTGGSPARSGPCDAGSAHGYLGIEDQATAAILAWIDGVMAAAKP